MHFWTTRLQFEYSFVSISGLVVEYIVAIDVTRVRFPADASFIFICLSRVTRKGFTTLPKQAAAWPNG